jgi:hypothetical protein
LQNHGIHPLVSCPRLPAAFFVDEPPEANRFTRRFHSQFGLTPTACRYRFARVQAP